MTNFLVIKLVKPNKECVASLRGLVNFKRDFVTNIWSLRDAMRDTHTLAKTSSGSNSNATFM
jgi:hypothetical protein